jgi:AraC family transcriptional regulator of adaptative response / DNA-3-methyladenine glycosylase II
VLGPLIERRPGLRVPSTVDGFELAVRAVVGQQVSVAGARTVLGRLAARYGEPLEADRGLARRFPSPAALAAADPADFPFPRVRGEALRALARLVMEGRLDLGAGADQAATCATLLEIRGVGPWTASYIGMRALGDRDAWLAGDVGLRNALERLGHPGDGAAALRQADAWRPWRSYAVMHLWASLESPGQAATL